MKTMIRFLWLGLLVLVLAACQDKGGTSPRADLSGPTGPTAPCAVQIIINGTSTHIVADGGSTVSIGGTSFDIHPDCSTTNTTTGVETPALRRVGQ